MVIRSSWPLRVGLAIAAAVAAGGVLGGCGWSLVPPEEAVLAGTWLLEHEDSDDLRILYEFDDLGRLTEVRYELGPITARVNSFSLSRVDVNGSSVHIRFEALLAATDFEGTLNAAKNRIEGQVTTHVSLIPGVVQVDIDNGPAVLVKQ
jgi:hypothetical protein